MKVSAKTARLAALVVMLAAPLSAVAQVPHVGVWTTIDPNDGSRSYIGVNAALQIVFFDSDATFGCREGGGGPFLGFDGNNGGSVRIEGHVLVGYIDGACQNGGKNHNTSFDFGMGHFPEHDTIRSRGTDWDRTHIDPETFVTNAFELEKLSSGAWEFLSGYSGGDPQIIPGGNCDDVDEFRPTWFNMVVEQELDFRACGLATVIFEGSNMNSLFREAYLGHASFENVSFHNADFSGADLTGVIMWLGGISGSNFRYADLRFMSFNAVFSLSDLDMYGADLRWATTGEYTSDGADINFRRANLGDADFRNLILGGTIDFRNANLTRAQFSTYNTATFLFQNTICPDGTNSNDNGGTCDLTTQSQPSNDIDSDGVLNDFDACAAGESGWTSNAATDHDNDGCRDASEDFDDDNDWVVDIDDYCPRGEVGWVAGSSTDYDDDGCKDNTEDPDDDNDGVTDTIDLCPIGGDRWWTSNSTSDNDGDGCRDVSEDFDDDNDGIADVNDNCPLVHNPDQLDADNDGVGDACVAT